MPTFASSHLRSALLALGMVVAPALAAAASINITFSGDATGAAPATSTSPGDPVTLPWAIGGYAPGYESPPTAAAGTILVGDVAGMSKGAIMTTASTNAELGALWMDVNGFTLPGQSVHVGFDINVLAAPTNATTQPKTLGAGTAGILLGMNAYTSNGWAYRFAAAPTSEAGGCSRFGRPTTPR